MLRCTYILCGSIVHWIRDTLYATVHLLLHIIVAMMKIGAPIKRNATNSAYCRSVAKSSVTAGTRANPYIQKIETIINWNYHFVTCVLCVCVQYFDVSAIFAEIILMPIKLCGGRSLVHWNWRMHIRRKRSMTSTVAEIGNSFIPCHHRGNVSSPLKCDNDQKYLWT